MSFFSCRWWVRSLRHHHPRSTGRRRASSLRLEVLQDRLVPATVINNATIGTLLFTADAGDADDVTVTTPTISTLRIVVGGGDTISLAGDLAGLTLSAGDTQLDVDTTINPLNF